MSVEGQQEATRQNLHRNPYFDSNEAFRLCDFYSSGRISQNEIRRLMSDRGHYISDQEAREITKKMDCDRDGVVSRGEFIDSVRPKSPSRRV